MMFTFSSRQLAAAEQDLGVDITASGEPKLP
jgi:hypothetical protein